MNQTTQARHLKILTAQGFIPPSLIHVVAGVSERQWLLDLQKYRANDNAPPLRRNRVTGKEGYFYAEFMAWLQSQTEIAA